MRHPRHLAAVPALALLIAAAFGAAATAQSAPLPNLTITSFAGPACVEIGQAFGDQVTLIMTNNGDLDLPAAPTGTTCSGQTENTCSSIGYYISADATITTGDALLTGGRENLVQQLPPGDSFDVGESVAVVLASSARVDAGSPTGSFSLGAIVDEQDTVTEANEGDNATSAATSPPVQIQIVPAGSGGCSGLLPDLVIDSFTHEPADPTTTDTIVLTAVVKNAGAVKAGDSAACIDVGGEICTNPTAEMLFAVPALAVGETFEVVRSVVLEVAQGYINNAVADVNQDVVESDEGNNTASDSFTVTEAPATVALIYQIVSLPVHGTLLGLDACSRQSPCDLPSVEVTYEPDEGFVGTDSFEFQVFDARTGLTSELVAAVGIFVAEALDVFDTPLTVDFQGSGRGDVTMDIGGSVVATCDDDCTKNFADGQLVKLQARPIDQYDFVGWGGACIVSQQNSQVASLVLPTQGATCTVTFSP